MRVRQRQETRRVTLRFEASSGQELERKVGNRVILPGSSGRLELIAERVLGACPIPLGPLMDLPGAGTVWSNALVPHGAVVTDRGGFTSCDAFLEWLIPVGQGQGAFMGLGPVAIVAIAGAIALALGALGWAISRLVLLVQAIIEALGPIGVGIFIALGVALVLGGLGAGRSRRRRT